MGDEEHKIYVGSLSFKTDDNSLREYFETQVDVVEAKVINDRETGRSRGFGFVTLHSEEDVRKAINELHDT
ncbi:Cinnamyl-alcohol dehydrogenase Flavonol reductase/cinnamoyl-CoA reductase, partial [Desmophyllum pertusum]